MTMRYQDSLISDLESVEMCGYEVSGASYSHFAPSFHYPLSSTIRHRETGPQKHQRQLRVIRYLELNSLC